MKHTRTIIALFAAAFCVSPQLIASEDSSPSVSTEVSPGTFVIDYIIQRAKGSTCMLAYESQERCEASAIETGDGTRGQSAMVANIR